MMSMTEVVVLSTVLLSLWVCRGQEKRQGAGEEERGRRRNMG